MLNPPLKSANSLIVMFISSLILVGVFGAVLLQIGAPTQFSALLFLIFAVGSYLFAGMFGVTTRLETSGIAERFQAGGDAKHPG
ncbi:MAG: hypothetical protein AAFX96_05210, partial [Pseudomonadota bacterium]